MKNICVTKKNGYSLLETMVVLLIVSILAAATAPMIAKKAARQGNSGDAGAIGYLGIGNNIGNVINNSSLLLGANRLPGPLGNNPSANGAKLYLVNKGNDDAHIAFGIGNSPNDTVRGILRFTNTNDNSTSGILLGSPTINAPGDGSVTIGTNSALASGANSIAIGSGATATQNNAVAIGNRVAASTADTIQLGDSEHPYNVNVGGGMTVAGQAGAASLTVTNEAQTGSLNVSGEATTQNLTVTNNASVTNNIAVAQVDFHNDSNTIVGSMNIGNNGGISIGGDNTVTTPAASNDNTPKNYKFSYSSFKGTSSSYPEYNNKTFNYIKPRSNLPSELIGNLGAGATLTDFINLEYLVAYGKGDSIAQLTTEKMSKGGVYASSSGTITVYKATSEANAKTQAINALMDTKVLKSLGYTKLTAPNPTVSGGSNQSATTTTTSTSASGKNSIAIGSGATATQENSVAIGAGASSSTANTIVLGTDGSTVSVPGSLEVNGVAVTSDKRIKNIGEKFTAGLNELKKLEIFNFTYKNDDKKIQHVGVMAQDLQKIFPNAVTEGSNGYLRIRFEDMFYAAVNAIKELDAKITAAIEQIKSNTDRISKLEKTVEEQKQIIHSQQETIKLLNENYAGKTKEFEQRLANLEKAK